MEMFFGVVFLGICMAFILWPNKKDVPVETKLDQGKEIPVEMSGRPDFQFFTVNRIMRQMTDLLEPLGLVSAGEADDYVVLLSECVFKGPIADSKLTIEQVMSAIDIELVPVYEYAKQLRQQGTPHPESIAMALKEWHRNHRILKRLEIS